MRDLSLTHDLPVVDTTQRLMARGLHLRLGGQVIFNDLSLSLDTPGITVLMGPNGAGKSQLLKLMHGLTRPDHGSLTWNGTPAPQATATQSLVFQTPVLLRRSVAANIDFVLKARGQDRSRSAALLAHVGLSDKARHPARALSGGEAQRLALARALATNPQVLLLDEPTASLDPASVLAIEQIVLNASARGVKVVLVTHDVGQARRLADEVLFLHRGQIAVQSPSAAFFPRPSHRAARDFIAGRITL